MFTGLMANSTVKDEATARAWYTKVFGREPDESPMPGLLEWRFAQEFGIQVWAEPERAGSSTVVIDTTELDRLAEQLSAAGIDHDGPQRGGGQRILPLSDPDGNRVVFFGS